VIRIVVFITSPFFVNRFSCLERAATCSTRFSGRFVCRCRRNEFAGMHFAGRLAAEGWGWGGVEEATGKGLSSPLIRAAIGDREYEIKADSIAKVIPSKCRGSATGLRMNISTPPLPVRRAAGLRIALGCRSRKEHLRNLLARSRDSRGRSRG